MKTNTKKWFFTSLMVLMIPYWGNSQVPYMRPRTNASSNGFWTQLSPTGITPVGRVRATAVYDNTNNRMIIFGGEKSQDNLLNDVWVLSNANGLGGTPIWTLLYFKGGPQPIAREGHTAVYDFAHNRMIIFGGFGGNSNGVRELNDVWVLSHANGLGGQPAWTQLYAGGKKPNGKWSPTAVYDPTTNQMIIFAGVDAAMSDVSAYPSDVWVLSNANGLDKTPSTWKQLYPAGEPPSGRASHTAVYDITHNRMIIYGGHRWGSSPLNDVWVLNNANGLGGTPAWTKISPTGNIPASRTYHAGVYDATKDRLTIFGGCDSDNGNLPNLKNMNDVWVLSHASGLGGTPTWTQLNPTGEPPMARSRHTGVYDSTNNRMIIFGGTDSDKDYLNDVWALSLPTLILAERSSPTTPAQSPEIFTVTPILPVNNQRIVIRGKGFGNSMPRLRRLGDSVDTIDENDSGTSIAIHDNGGGAHSWAAGRITSGNLDAIGLKLVSWNDSEIVLDGFGSALGESWKIAPGDPIEVVVFGPENSGKATFMSTVVSPNGNADDSYVRPRSAVFYDNFQRNDLGPWIPVEGDWQVRDGKLYCNSINNPSFIVVGDSGWRDYILELKAMMIEGNEAFSIGFRIKNIANNLNSFIWGIGSYNNTVTDIIERTTWRSPQTVRLLTERKYCHIEPGRWYDIKVFVKGNSVKCYLDNNLVQEYQGTELEAISSGKIGLGVWTNARAYFADVKVTLIK